MKILHIISQRPESTGSGFYLQNLIRQASLAGHRNYLIAGISAGELPKLECINEKSCSFIGFAGGDLDFPIPGMSDVMPYQSSIFGNLSREDINVYEKVFAEKIRTAVDIFRPDIIHSHHLWIVTATARRAVPELPILTSCHSTDLRQFLNCTHLQERVLEECQKVEIILALSRDQGGKIKELYGIPENRINIVGGGYDENLFNWSLKPEPPPVHLLYAGKLSFAKGVNWLLRSCRQLSKLPLHVHLAGSGSGEEAKECLKLAEKLGASITVHGNIPQKQLSSLMRSCHIFVLPSFYEGLPLVLLEALASGCRIITTDLPGSRELLGQGDSNLIEFVTLPQLKSIDQPHPEDWERLDTELASAITRIVERVMVSPAPSQNEIDRITSAYHWPAVFERVLTCYQKVIDNKV